METTAIVFWVSAGFVAYTYVAYPLLVWVLSRLKPLDDAPGCADEELPQVTIVMAVHNEAQRLPRKLQNLRELDYPADRIRILVVSDGSSDGTHEWLAAQPGIEFIGCSPRRGKAHALNVAMERVTSPVTVLADARQLIEPGAIRFMVQRLQHPRVGAVSAELVHRDPLTHEAANIGMYWRYEKFIRKSESRLWSTVGATGALYALRTRSYVPLPTDTLLDDFLVPMYILRSGMRVVMEDRAIVYDELQTQIGGELKRKTRTLAGNWQALVRYPWMLSPWHNPAFVQLVSHKLFRLLVPYALVLALVSSILASGILYGVVSGLQLCFYGLALAASVHPGLRANRVLNFCSVFIALNWAAVLGLREYLLRRLDAKWDKTS
jgi:cellulose synthase/poly-beta-1,6-N-acetylglucosamine synthase-like glycosyltransferase